jgi:hypothetical protein
MQRLPGPHLTHHVRLFPHRSPRRSSANAAEGGLKPPPEGRLREADNLSSLVQHHFPLPIASGSLQRSWHTGFSEERKLHFQFPVAALEFTDPLVFWHSCRKGLPCKLLPVGFHPEAEGSVVHSEFPCYLGDWQGVIYDFPGSLLLEFRSVSLPFFLHSFPFLSRRILLDPCPGTVGHLSRAPAAGGHPQRQQAAATRPTGVRWPRGPQRAALVRTAFPRRTRAAGHAACTGARPSRPRSAA